MLRKLEEKDIPYMLEWMHDEDINKGFQKPFLQATEETAREFILHSFDEEFQHFAIVNEDDEYLGTISLKRINYRNKNAEYAIVLRKKAQGTGIAQSATLELLNYAFQELKLHKIYLSVLENNVRARKMYERCGFKQEGISVDEVWINNHFENHIWYGIIDRKENEHADC